MTSFSIHERYILHNVVKLMKYKKALFWQSGRGRTCVCESGMSGTFSSDDGRILFDLGNVF